MLDLTPGEQARLWTKVLKTDYCWQWKGACRASGVGIIKLRGHLVPARRITYQLACGDIPAGQVVLSMCGNPRCVRPDHLRLGPPSSRLTANQVREIRHLYQTTAITQRELAGQFNICLTAINAILTGRTWPANTTRSSNRHRHARGERHHSAKLHEAEVRTIRAVYAAGKTSMAELARIYGVDAMTIHALVRGKTWKHIR